MYAFMIASSVLANVQFLVLVFTYADVAYDDDSLKSRIRSWVDPKRPMLSAFLVCTFLLPVIYLLGKITSEEQVNGISLYIMIIAMGFFSLMAVVAWILAWQCNSSTTSDTGGK